MTPAITLKYLQLHLLQLFKNLLKNFFKMIDAKEAYLLQWKQIMKDSLQMMNAKAQAATPCEDVLWNQIHRTFCPCTQHETGQLPVLPNNYKNAKKYEPSSYNLVACGTTFSVSWGPRVGSNLCSLHPLKVISFVTKWWFSVEVTCYK